MNAMESQLEQIALVARRTIRATPARVFAAWTTPEHLRRWWGPRHVICPEAEVDLRVGGKYRIANQLPDGKVVWIEGEFESIEPPDRLVYSWRLGADTTSSERVTVRFEPRDGATEVIVVHERIQTQASRDEHAQGWEGCLEGLDELMRTGDRARPF